MEKYKTIMIIILIAVEIMVIVLKARNHPNRILLILRVGRTFHMKSHMRVLLWTTLRLLTFLVMNVMT